MDRSRRLLPALLLALALALAACGGGGGDASPDDASEAPATSAAASVAVSEPAEPSGGSEASEAAGEEVRVQLDGFAFDTEELTIAAGTEVSFLNADSAPHTVTEGTDGQAADSPIIDEDLAPNQGASFTFDEPGTYELTCLLHPSMNMTVIVES
jgi:plastocyanin